MSARRRLPVALAAAVALGLATVTTVGVAVPAGAAAPDYVKYYRVASSSETLASVAQRFLGTAERGVDIYEANAGRKQPDGGVVGRTGPLRAGWLLVLPFDAVGTGVKYGLLPAPAPPAAATTTAPAPTPVRPRATTAPPVAQPKPKPRPTASKKPAAKPKPKPVPRATSTCQGVAGQKAQAEDWAALRLAADQAWVRTRGRGQTVAVIDSGVDGSLPQLAGRTMDGADVVGGTGRGNADCLGSGTAMAGIIAGQPVAGSPVNGLAPDAAVLPIRIATTQPTARGVDVATAVRMAVTAGATVIVLGSYADTTDRAVATALHDAVVRGSVVVTPALPAGPPLDPEVERLTEGVLRVGGIGVDGQMMTGYRTGGVHLVAPGKDVAALGITGVGMLPVSGGQYAAAFVGATAALVRSAFPELTAAQVIRRLEATADRMPDDIPTGRYGYGLVSPRSAVEMTLAEETPPPDPAAVAAAERNDRRLPALLVIVGLALIVALLLAVRVRRLVVARDEAEAAAAGEPRPTRHRRPEPPADDDPPGPGGDGSEWSREAAGSGLAYRASRRADRPPTTPDRPLTTSDRPLTTSDRSVTTPDRPLATSDRSVDAP
jgi:membrane-anchored mycosin MYCP